MEENKKSVDGIIEKLALISDALDNTFPEAKMAILLELNDGDFKKVQSNFRDLDKHHNQFKIEISNTEFMFLRRDSLNDETNTLLETPSPQE